jgi:hypothetical protein
MTKKPNRKPKRATRPAPRGREKPGARIVHDGDVVLEVRVVEGDSADVYRPTPEERRSIIRLHKRLVRYEQVSRRIIENPETTPRRRALAEQMLQAVRDARAMWDGGEPPVAMMGGIERMAGMLNWLTLLPLAGRGHKFTGGKLGKGDLWKAVAEVLRAEPPRLTWREVLRLVVPRLPKARLSDRALTYGDGAEVTLAAFKTLVSQVRADLRRKSLGPKS